MKTTKVLLALLPMLAGLSAGGAVAGEGRYDGRWTIEVSASGLCPVSRQQLVAVIANNRLIHLSGVPAAGRVGNDGGFSATFSKMGESAHAGGRLGGSSGAGTWSSASKICSGSWRAHRSRVAQAD